MILKSHPVLRKIFGASLIILGVMGLIMPILPGWIFIFFGLEMLGLKLLLSENFQLLRKKFKKPKIF
ncbi:MAG: hypothetical protein COZ34_01585 [Candidatus Pacebacteria bacterium CG_4_10_14_3_um_filter_34_15]|nr:MAG: hypothetical protein AUJ41_01610 [Candidatus Pacebacteria bacterium CG1_02_43_31]PIQ81208.1 MAG: hypothetical protein COV78_01450 [Candidatus Pacebacteria bacterium CG11_big_fil_rev_8_21_14_0_20_34_55]PIX81778.1 MAG: hypothetical protein COZ34_01585 [Candidatus Pacebacteria bacterium CG_4_10_14_3_um_filter_34_15]PJC43705.1 MAG: hypothetical protein CO039_02630 [Candidatus Pacebacteria bacterium CG_4_9_14_0_2_um_filter_34_50]